MENGRFTKEEREYLLSLDVVDEARATPIIYSKQFKQDCMGRYHADERPADIFASVGLPSSLIGYRRIERAIYRWKEAERRGALAATGAPRVHYRNRADTIRAEKRAAVARQKAIRGRCVFELEEKAAKQKARAKSREEEIMAAQAAEIASPKAQVKALKHLARWRGRLSAPPRRQHPFQRGSS